jgi:DNA polymerase III alpha subunit
VETLGFLLSAHPLEPFERALKARGVIRACDLPRHAGRRVRLGGWFVSSKLAQTKDKEPMEFLSFEDTTALYDATIFPDAYRRFCHLLTSTRPFVLEGRVEEDYGVCTLTVEGVERL